MPTGRGEPASGTPGQQLHDLERAARLNAFASRASDTLFSTRLEDPRPNQTREISLAGAGRRPYNRRAMTRKQIDVSIYVFLILLIAFFARAVWGVMGMIGWV